MKMNLKLASALVATAFLALTSASASAGIINFTFTNVGSVDGATSCGANCLLVATSGLATENSGLAGSNSWAFSGLMKFSSTSLFTAEGDGSGKGLGWSFVDTAGGDNLWGSFDSDIATFFGLFGSGAVDYTIGGGSGLFAGASGYGVSTLDLGLSQFWENCWMKAVTATTSATASVPEPGITTLLLAGFGMIGFMAYRRRRATTKI